MERLVIFDLDGTLLDTLGDLCDATNFALAGVGKPLISIDDVRRFIGNGTKKLIERALGEGFDEQTVADCTVSFTQYYGEHYNDKTYAYDGIKSCVDCLIDNGVAVGVVTNKLDAMSKKLCAEHFGDVFLGVVGDVAGLARKPDPQKVLKMIADAEADECIIVGDSTVDVQTAKNARVPCIAVSWGFNTRRALEESCPDIIVDTAEELMPAVEKLLNVKLVDKSTNIEV